MRVTRSGTLMLCIFALAAMCSWAASAETWYVRADGGSRYSAKMTSGQCDGKADAAYSGHGKNQHCAFKDYRFLFDDQSYGKPKWVIAGGDTVIVRGGPWRVGFDQGKDAHDVWCFGADGPYACTNPPIPAGTAAQHTRILGEHYADCGSNKNKTQLFGGFGVGTVINMNSTQYVDVGCFEITRHSDCMTHGSPALPKGCNTSYPLDDYDSDGITTDVHTRDVLMQDLWIHGHPDRGIKGAIGGVVTANRVVIAINGTAGWDFDDGSGTPSVDATWNFINSVIEWSGCNQEYPQRHPIPVASCYGQSTGGYGDGVGTPQKTCMSANIDHSIFRYNTQDGLDLGHIDTGQCSLKITNSAGYGNSGGQFKWGPNEHPAIFLNNLVIGNCMRLSAPMTGAPMEYNKNLQDFCRAEDTISFNFRQGGSALFANNTIVGYSPTMFDIGCWDDSCSNSTLVFKNNIVRGYDNPKTYSLGGKEGGPGGFYYAKPIGKVVREHNIYYGLRGFRCPGANATERCADPKLMSNPNASAEQEYDNFNFHLQQGSPALGTGVKLGEVPVDFDGKQRPADGSPDLGAYQH